MTPAHIEHPHRDLKEFTMIRSLFAAVALLASASVSFAQDIPLSKILVEKDGWRDVVSDFPDVAFLEGVPGGDLYIYQAASAARVTAAGKLEKFDATPKARSASFAESPEGRWQIDPKEGVTSKTGAKLKLDIPNPSCLTLWPDRGHLAIAERDGAWLWAVRIEPDGSFGPGDRYYSLRTHPGRKTDVSAMTMDAEFLLYACTSLGIQIFDPTGRLSGVVPAPTKARLTAIAIGGAGHDQLFVACGDKIFARRIQKKAVYTLAEKK